MYGISVALNFTEEAVEICSLTREVTFGTQYLRCVPGTAAVDLGRITVHLTLFQLDKHVLLESPKEPIYCSD
jgi:hypothetical protein